MIIKLKRVGVLVVSIVFAFVVISWIDYGNRRAKVRMFCDEAMVGGTIDGLREKAETQGLEFSSFLGMSTYQGIESEGDISVSTGYLTINDKSIVGTTCKLRHMNRKIVWKHVGEG